MEPDEGHCHYHHALSCGQSVGDEKFTSVQIITRRRNPPSHHLHNHRFTSLSCSSHHHHSPIMKMLSSPYLLVVLIMCLVAPLAHSLPMNEMSSPLGVSGSSSSSHRSQLDLLIDPIHQAEYEGDIEEKRVVAKSVFDMVLRTPPPPTSSSVKCPPGTQSPYEGAPCYTKSTGPVALVDQSLLLDTLRGLAKEGVLMTGGKKRPGGGGGRRRPSLRPNQRYSSTTPPAPTTTMPATSEVTAQTTLITSDDISESTEVVKSSSPLPPSTTPVPISPSEVVTPAEVVMISGVTEESLPATITEIVTPEPVVPEAEEPAKVTPMASELQQSSPIVEKQENDMPATTTVPSTSQEKSGQVQTSAEEEGGEIRILADARRNSSQDSTSELSSTYPTTVMTTTPSTTFTTELTTPDDEGSTSDLSTVTVQPEVVARPSGAVEMTGVNETESMASSPNQDVKPEPSPRREDDEVADNDDNLRETQTGVIRTEPPPPSSLGENTETVVVIDDNSTSPVSDDKVGTTEVDGIRFVLTTKVSPANESREQEPRLSREESSNNNTTATTTVEQLLDETPEDRVLVLPKEEVMPLEVAVTRKDEDEQMITRDDMSMTAQQPLEPKVVEGEAPSIPSSDESGQVENGVIGRGDSDLPVVNHLEMMSEPNDMEREDQGGTVEDEGATTTTGEDDDLLIINNPTVSPATSEDQVLLAKDGEETVLTTISNIADILQAQKGSSSREPERRDGGDAVAQPPDLDAVVVDDDDYASELVVQPEISTLLPSSSTPSLPFRSEDTLLQFQLPIVNREPSSIGGGFQRFPEFPSGATSTGRIRFPNEVPNGERAPEKSSFGGTFRPVYTQDFQLDYPPQQRWESPKPFPSAADLGFSTPSSIIEYDSGSTEYLESELDRRHQKTRSRNRITASETTTNQPLLPPELSLYSHHPPISSEDQTPSPSTHPFYFGRRSPSSDLIPFEYLNLRNAADRLATNKRRLVW